MKQIKKKTSAPIPVLSKEDALEMMELLIMHYGKETFQNRLHAGWDEAAGQEDPELKQAMVKQSLSLEVQGPVIALYGFEPSRKGVFASTQAYHKAFGATDIKDEDKLHKESLVEWLVNPARQRATSKQESVVNFELARSLRPGRKMQDMFDDIRARRDETLAEVARRIAAADVLLLCTGAGFSADSGLAVYADVARVPAYADKGLTYRDVCRLAWLKSEPEFFWGFWGQCFNDYRDTAPHRGYEVISRWVEQRFRHSSFAEAVRQRCQTNGEINDPTPNVNGPYRLTEWPGAFSAFTSNVDAHHFDWFAASEIREAHGNIELYQCVQRCRRHCLWRAPLDFRFHVDKATMLARSGEPGANQAVAYDANASEAGPRVGQVRGGGRPMALRHMPGPAPDAAAVGFSLNHPVCPHCNGLARPAIAMFDDARREDFREQARRSMQWGAAVTQEIYHRSGDVRAVILEIGAGSVVPTVRGMSEDILRTWRQAGADVRLVRVNPESPLADNPSLADLVISIMDSGLASLLQIDAAMKFA